MPDVNAAIVDPVSGRMLAFGADYLRPEWQAIDPAARADIEFLNHNAGGAWALQSQSHDNRLWTIGVDRVTEPYSFYLYDRERRTLERLFTTRPALEGKSLAAMHPRKISSRDGLALVSYLSLPPGTDADGDGAPERPLPLVLYVHGGPWARDSYGYNSVHQWLANRGYAVLSVNYRGSTGFGKSFLNAADGEFAGRMHESHRCRTGLFAGVTTQNRWRSLAAPTAAMPRRPDLHAGILRLRCRYRRPVEPGDPDRSFPSTGSHSSRPRYRRVGDPRTRPAGRRCPRGRRSAAWNDPPAAAGRRSNDPRVTRRPISWSQR